MSKQKKNDIQSTFYNKEFDLTKKKNIDKFQKEFFVEI